MGTNKISTPLVFIFLQLATSQLALCGSVVKFIPGFDGPLPLILETGYIGVGESGNVQLFYYFFPSENDPKEDPLLLWFTGGPGCSTISAILYEIGPLKFEEVMYNGSLPRLELNPYSWTKVVSIIFLDQPVGTGFSYARTAEASQSGDLETSRNVNEFLRKWLIDHPEFQSNPVYLGGDSYSGITVPLYFQEMLHGNEMGTKPFINLKGYLLGNPSTSFTEQGEFIVPYAHGMGLISDELYESLQRTCKGNYSFQTLDPENVACMLDLMSFYKCIIGIRNTHILEPICGFGVQKSLLDDPLESLRRSLYADDSQEIMSRQTSSSPPLNAFWCRDDGYLLSYYWLNDERVREAIHVKKGSIKTWIRCNYGLNYTYNITSSVPYHKFLSSKGYPSLIYSGDHDMVVPFLATQAWVRSLGYPIVDDWRSWVVEGQVGGYTRTYSNNVTFATVKGGGHTAPEYRPKECYAMFERWISGQPL